MRSAVALALMGPVLVAGTLWTRSANGSADKLGPCPPVSGSKHGGSLGQVLRVRRVKVFLANGQGPAAQIHSGFKLYPGNTLCTDHAGVMSFKLDSPKSHTHCNVRPNSRFTLSLQPNGQTVITYQPGRYHVGCDARGGIIEAPHKTEVQPSHEPVFTIAVAPGKSVISMGRGFVKVGRPGVPGGRIVGPDEQVSASLATISRPSKLGRLGTDQRELLAELEAGLPKPAYARPSSPAALESSPTLQRIGNSRQLVIGLGPELDSDSLSFAKAYFSFLAGKWSLGKKAGRRRKKIPPVVFRLGITPAKASKLLGAGRLDLFLTQTPPRKTLVAPFFEDNAKRTWQFVVKGDPVFLHAMTTFLGAALDTGDYNSLYRKSLADQPPIYRAVEPLIFPAIRCTPSAHADLAKLIDLRLDLGASPSGPLSPGTQVVQTATVTNIGRRVVDCVTLDFHVFGGLPLNDADLVRAGCTQTFPPGREEADLSCELGRLGLRARKSLQVIVEPTAGSAHSETCADVNADESGGLPEVNRADNGACADLVYRTAPLAPLVVGAAEDKVQYSPDPKAENPLDRLGQQAKFQLLKRAGFGAVVVTAPWIPGRTAPLRGQLVGLKSAAAAAQANRIDLVLAVYNFDDRLPPPPPLTAAQDTPVTAAERDEFAAYTAALVRDVHEVRTVVVGNEPNNGKFWMPQYGQGNHDVAADAYEALLARTYDAVKAVDPSVAVVGGALAPRGASTPKPGRDTHSPVDFVGDLGAAYEASGRTAPIMDAFALHPIPEGAATPPTTQHPSPTSVLGIADYPFLVSLLGRAFDGKGKQLGSTLPIYYTEYAVRSAPRQAAFYRKAIELASCEPTVAGLFIFHAFDQPEPSPWQSGVYRFDGKLKPSLAPVRAAARAAQTRDVSSCPPLPRAP